MTGIPLHSQLVEVDGHRLNSDCLPLRIYDWLSHNGEWQTITALALRLNANPNGAKRALYRLKHRGVVVSRLVDNGRRGPISEWRAT